MGIGILLDRVAKMGANLRAQRQSAKPPHGWSRWKSQQYVVVRKKGQVADAYHLPTRVSGNVCTLP